MCSAPSAIIALTMGSIFVSYRREGGSGFAGRIEADLQRRFGSGEVFRDVDDLTSGEDFVQGLQRALRTCRVLIVVVSKTWLSAAAAGGAGWNPPPPPSWSPPASRPSPTCARSPNKARRGATATAYPTRYAGTSRRNCG